MERFAKLVTQALTPIFNHPISITDLESPPNPELGDFAFPCFKLAKERRLAPPAIAQLIKEEILAKNSLPVGLSISSAGPYVNFTVDRSLVVHTLLADILAGPNNGTYGKEVEKSKGSWVLEYSSPNVAKPFQIYHLRPTALGAALDRIGRFRGFDVTSINHLGDWGTQYGKLAVAIRMFGSELPAEPTILDLVSIYVKFHTAAEQNPALDDEAREAFLKLEKDDPEMIALWQKCVDISMKEFLRIYGRIHVSFDHYWGESFYKKQLEPLLQSLREKQLLIESEGAWVVPVTDSAGNELPPCILQKKDGATIYATRDVAAAIYRHEQFNFKRMTYIVGGEQKLHFQQVFAVLKKMGFNWVDRCEHIPTGLYRFKDAKMSTRKGNFVTFEDVLALANERVRTLMQDRAKSQNTELPADFETICEKIAVGAVVYNDLQSDPARDVEFDVERVVDFEGETGPYLQYAHTRCLSILRKAGNAGFHLQAQFTEKMTEPLTAKEELQLVKTLGQFPIHLERTLKLAKASQLAQYLIDVTKAFGAFYRECHVIDEKHRERTVARLALVEATRRILAQGLSLLGVPLPDKM